MPSYYEILGVAPDVDQSRIHDAYVEAVRAAPAADGGPGARDRQLDEAYAVVGDPDRRRRYDALRASEGGGGNAELLALLAVIADKGSIPTAEDVLGPPDIPPAHGAATPSSAASPSDAVPSDHGPPPAPGAEGAGTAADAAATGPVVGPPNLPRRPEPGTGAEPVRPHGATRAAPDGPAEPPGDRPAATAPPPGAQRPAARPAGTRSSARRRPKVPGTDGDVAQLRRRRTTVGVVLAALIAGIAGGLLYAQRTPDRVELTAGACVSLTAVDATAVPCDAEGVDARITEVVATPADCPDSPLGAIALEDGAGCLEPVGAGATQEPDPGGS